jgi:hypothetical protein
MFGEAPRSIRLFEGVILADLILLISRRKKNWSRWVFVGLYVIELLVSFMAWRNLAAASPGFPLTMLGNLFLQTIFVILLFTPQSIVWFRKWTSLADTFN